MYSYRLKKRLLFTGNYVQVWFYNVTTTEQVTDGYVIDFKN